MARQRFDLKSRDEVARIRAACRVVRQVLNVLRDAVRPGVSTAALDRIAEERTRAFGATPAFLGYRGYPASACISINEEIVHGIPSASRVLKEGDIVGIDFGAVLDGFYGDAAISIGVGEISAEAGRLLEVTSESLTRGIRAAQPGKRIGDIGASVQEFVEAQGFSVVRDFVGHGIGRNLHEPPHVPNYGSPGTGDLLLPGMVLAIEPMVNAGTPETTLLGDGWTAVTADGALSAHFENTIVITADGPEILTGDGP
ncbi:MAG: type I methionyl aminopeptidase [Anaeromyxobacteraceae bacterium]